MLAWELGLGQAFVMLAWVLGLEQASFFLRVFAIPIDFKATFCFPKLW